MGDESHKHAKPGPSKEGKKSAANKKKLVNDLYTNQEQPEKALSFLRNLHTTLDPSAALIGSHNNKKAGSASKSNAKRVLRQKLMS